MSVNDDLRKIYDRYFASHEYEARYPHPNAGTFDCLHRHGISAAHSVLDLGCGNGRYTLPLLHTTRARFTGCDPSASALQGLCERLDDKPEWRRRLSVVQGDVHTLNPAERFDFMLMLFGVLGHIETQTARVGALTRMRQLALPHCTLVLTVPSVWRRRPIESLRSWWSHRHQTEDVNWRDIHFERVIDHEPMRFFYHLYTWRELQAELKQSGWRVMAFEAESILPEWWITPRPWLNRLDAQWSTHWPSAWGYGLRVVAQPETA